MNLATKYVNLSRAADTDAAMDAYSNYIVFKGGDRERRQACALFEDGSAFLMSGSKGVILDAEEITSELFKVLFKEDLN